MNNVLVARAAPLAQAIPSPVPGVKRRPTPQTAEARGSQVGQRHLLPIASADSLQALAGAMIYVQGAQALRRCSRETSGQLLPVTSVRLMMTQHEPTLLLGVVGSSSDLAARPAHVRHLRLNRAAGASEHGAQSPKILPGVIAQMRQEKPLLLGGPGAPGEWRPTGARDVHQVPTIPRTFLTASS
jgi:hypothetical protein